jgi:arylamine N-acetyltransferase
MNLQECLDEIGYIGVPQVSQQDMFVIFEKFCKRIPFSTTQSIGELKAYNATDFYNRVINQKVGGVCMELAYVLNYILEQVGFTTNYVGFDPNTEEGMMVKVVLDNEEWLLNPSSRASGLYYPLKIMQNYLHADHKVTYEDSMWCIKKWQDSEWRRVFTFDNTNRDFLFWQQSFEERSQKSTDFTVQNNIISTVTDSGMVMYYNGTITTRTVDGVTTEQYTNQDLVDLFNYHGTV